MAVAFDTSAVGGTTAGSAFSFSHTCTGSNLYLVVAVVAMANNSAGVTYNSVAMSLISRANLSAAVNCRVELWGLINPATGAHNVTVTPGAGGANNKSAVSSSWTGVDQTTPIGTPVQTIQDAISFTSISRSVSSAAGEMVVDGMTCYNQTPTKGASQTLIANQATGSAPNCASSYQPGAGSVTNSWTWASNMVSAQIAVALKPVAGAAPQQPVRWSFQPFLAQ